MNWALLISRISTSPSIWGVLGENDITGNKVSKAPPSYYTGKIVYTCASQLNQNITSTITSLTTTPIHLNSYPYYKLTPPFPSPSPSSLSTPVVSYNLPLLTSTATSIFRTNNLGRRAANKSANERRAALNTVVDRSRERNTSTVRAGIERNYDICISTIISRQSLPSASLRANHLRIERVDDLPLQPADALRSL